MTAGATDPAAAGGVDPALQRAVYESVLVRARAAVEQFVAEHDQVLRALPVAVAYDLVAQVVAGFLVGVGVLDGPLVDAPGEWPGRWQEWVPEQLRPDVDRVFGGYQRLLKELGDGEPRQTT